MASAWIKAGIDGKPFTADQPLVDTALQYGLEQPARQVAVAEVAVPVRREGRVIGYVTVETQSAKME